MLEGMHDSGERRLFASGAVRDTVKGKGRFVLLPPEALTRDALWAETGEQKYGPRNWEKGINISDCMDSLFRHYVKYMLGYTDEDHLAAIRWNAAAVMWFEANLPQMQDLPNRTDKEEEPWITQSRSPKGASEAT